MNHQRNGRPLLLVALALGALPLLTAAAPSDQGNARGQQQERTQPKQQERTQPKQQERTQPKQTERTQPEEEREKPKQEREAEQEKRATTAERGAETRGNARWAGRSKEDIARFKRYLQEEAKHRQRMTRVERLRELARKEESSERLEQLQALGDRETERYEQAMQRFRTEMGDQDFRDAKAFVERFGTTRGRQQLESLRDRGNNERTQRPGTGDGR